MKVLITVGSGLLASELKRVAGDSIDIILAPHSSLDVTSARTVDSAVASGRPDVVINCAAIKDIVRCERERDLAYAVNALGCANIATACDRHGVRCVSISSDYVFSGERGTPYDEFSPVIGTRSEYGRSKYAGEQYVRSLCTNYAICRVAWLYAAVGESFVSKLLNAAAGRASVKVVSDQIGNPTSAASAAEQILRIAVDPLLRGTFHVTCSGSASRAELAREIFRLNSLSCHVEECTSSSYPDGALRPRDSRLDNMVCRLVGLPEMPDWRSELCNQLRG